MVNKNIGIIIRPKDTSAHINHEKVGDWCDSKWAVYTTRLSITDEDLIFAVQVGQELCRVTCGQILVYRGIDFELAVSKFNELIK